MSAEATKILVVEDERIVAEAIELSLERQGFNVVANVATGQEAVRAAEAADPDLVLMDVRLRGEMDGIEAAAAIHTRFSKPIIFLTAYGDADTLERAKSARPHGYLLKPFQERDLIPVIELALDRHRWEVEREGLLQDLAEAHEQITELRGAKLCVCAWCRRIWDGGEWLCLDHYLANRLDARFSHDLCGDCDQQLRQR